MRRRNTGVSLTGLLIIGAILYFTGAGVWLWNRVKELDSSCYALLQQLGTDMGGPVCDGLARGIAMLDHGVSGAIEQVKGHNSNAVNELESYANNLLGRVSNGRGSLADLSSAGDRLRDLMNQQPIVLPEAVDAKERLRLAVDQYVIGQRLLQGESSAKALPWFTQSAQQPGGFGVFSQLTLGDMYRSGSYGVGKDASAAREYYEQARQSIASLQQAGTPEANQLLKSLPLPADQLSAQLERQVQRMK